MDDLRIRDSRLIPTRRHQDDRGILFFSDLDIPSSLLEANSRLIYSRNPKRGTFRGIHTQIGKQGEAKYVFCTKGSILDFSVDLRTTSESYLASQSIHLESKSGILFLPRGIGHGFQTLEDETELTYLVLGESSMENYRRWNYQSKEFQFNLPLEISQISFDDQTAPFFNS